MEDVVGFEVKISREATTIEAKTVLNMESVWNQTECHFGTI